MMTLKTNIPEAGQWPDKIALPALAIGAVLLTAGFLLASMVKMEGCMP